MKKFILLFFILIIPFLLSACGFFAKTYNVKTITSHYPHRNDNSETYLYVYLKGHSGHTKQVFCAFPPDIQLQGNNATGWTGLKKVKVGKAYKEYYFGQVSYLCEKVK